MHDQSPGEQQLHPLTLEGKEIENVETFKYLGRMFTEMDSDMPARWHKLGKILRQKTVKNGCKPILISVNIHTALLFGSESWTSDTRKLSLLRVQQRVQQRILRSTFGLLPTVTREGDVLKYRYPSRALGSTQLEEIADIFKRRRLAFYIKTLSTDGRHLALKERIEIFERPGTETPQHNDGRHAWWTRQSREFNSISRMIKCITLLVEQSKGSDDNTKSRTEPTSASLENRISLRVEGDLLVRVKKKNYFNYLFWLSLAKRYEAAWYGTAPSRGTRC